MVTGRLSKMHIQLSLNSKFSTHDVATSRVSVVCMWIGGQRLDIARNNQRICIPM